MDKFKISFKDLSPEAQERWKKFIEPHVMDGCLEEYLKDIPVAVLREGCPSDAGAWSHDRSYFYNDLMEAFEKFSSHYDRDYLADDKEVARILDKASDNIFRIYDHKD